MWDWFIQFIANVLTSLAGFTGDWGLAVIILTLIIRLLIMPLMTRSTASSAKMQALQPMMQDIQTRYADDPERQAQELQKFYAENKFNPLGGCLPVFLQMPVFFALFSVTRDYVPADASFLSIIPTLGESAASMFNISNPGPGIIYLVLVLLFGVLTLIPMLMNAKNMSEDQRGQSLMMGIMMSVMMVWIGFRLPAAVLLYYDTSAIWQVVQQQLVTQRVMEKVKADTTADLEARGIQQNNIQVVRRERKQRQHKKH